MMKKYFFAKLHIDTFKVFPYKKIVLGKKQATQIITSIKCHLCTSKKKKNSLKYRVIDELPRNLQK